MKYELLRDGEPKLVFQGERLAHVSSEGASKRRWTELSLYETGSGKYVVETVAVSTFPNETDWHAARSYDTIDAMLDGLRDRRKRTLSKLALELLEVAADESHLVLDALEELEASEEVIS